MPTIEWGIKDYKFFCLECLKELPTAICTKCGNAEDVMKKTLVENMCDNSRGLYSEIEASLVNNRRVNNTSNMFYDTAPVSDRGDLPISPWFPSYDPGKSEVIYGQKDKDIVVRYELEKNGSGQIFFNKKFDETRKLAGLPTDGTLEDPNSEMDW